MMSKVSKFANKLKNIDIGIKSFEKKLFLSNLGLFLTAKENGTRTRIKTATKT